MASTGSSRAAFIAGYVPKIKPTEMETKKARRMELMVTMVDHPAIQAISLDIPKPVTTPRKPPAKEISTASMTNWRTMSERRAPMARRTPISRVRSRMAANMMFMMPIPPTSREMEAMATMTVLKSCSVRFLGQKLGGHDDAEVPGIVMRGIEDATNHFGV